MSLPGAKGRAKLRGDRNGASSSQNELGREQSDEQRGVGFREGKPEGSVGEQLLCGVSGVGDSQTQPVSQGMVEFDITVHST